MKLNGWATTSDLDAVRHSIVPSAFSASIHRRGLSGPRGIRLLLGHDSQKPAGVITKLEARNKGLWIEAELSESISYARDAAEAIRAAGGLSFSVGFWVQDADIAEDRDGREYLVILKGDLHEVSVVTFPANEAAQMERFE